MEVVEECSIVHSPIDVKTSVVVAQTSAKSTGEDVCHKSNGVDEVVEAGAVEEVNETVNTTEAVGIMHDVEPSLEVLSTAETGIMSSQETLKESDNTQDVAEPTDLATNSVEKTDLYEVDITTGELQVELNKTESSCIEVINSESSNIVTFKTEVLVEKNDPDIIENNLNENEVKEDDAAHTILSELGQSIELSEVLRSSDVTESIENNNGAVRHEVFNKEELLDILQGKDVESAQEEVVQYVEVCTVRSKSLEAQIALQQLNRLKTSKRGMKSSERTPKMKKSVDASIDDKKPENIVNVLVQDWNDEEPSGADKCIKTTEESAAPSKSSSELKEVLSIMAKEEPTRTSIDSPTSEDQSQKSNKSGDESQPQRRLGRIIKKKVIFDPDNPDTFTKSKTSKIKKNKMETDQSPIKKGKIELMIQRSSSKSPISKLPWKKPTPKNSKQNKRLTEVDKLLMDEGAVNMIYQLTPEAPKGKKNVKTKAEFIKKIQSSTPDSKEMKFRERKKDASKYEDGEAKKILSGKHRASLSSSVKSPSVCEEFETHSADDSIIYRRHSSSSYSSTCMSPRRLSDVDSGSTNNNCRSLKHVTENLGQGSEAACEVINEVKEAFMSDCTNISSSEMINKDDCLSIKEKLNSKLSLALNKRKRESFNNDKSPKQKKIKDTLQSGIFNNFKHLSIHIDQTLAEICIQKVGSKYSIEVLRELQQSLELVDASKDISVTLLTSQCGTLCSSLNLKPILEDDSDKRMKNAYEIAECISSLLICVERHSKLLCSGVWGACSGVAMALVALSDMALASDCATFGLSNGESSARNVTLLPGIAAFTARCRALPQSLINDLVVFGRRISATEAVQGGLVSRCLWPDRFRDQLRNIAKDIAAQPIQNVLMKKQLLTLKKNAESTSTFLTCLEMERDLFIKYWSSVEGQELLRADQHAS